MQVLHVPISRHLPSVPEQILESIRAKKGDTDNVKSPEETEKDKNETENDSKDAEKSREFEDQSLEKDSEYKTPDDDPEQGKSEEPIEVGDKGNSVSANLDDNTTNASSEETSAPEGRSPKGCLSETPDSSNMAEKKVASELPQDVPGTEGSISMPLHMFTSANNGLTLNLNSGVTVVQMMIH
ncbi:hypothetical protein H8959_012920 [Pygathrix nigripes]